MINRMQTLKRKMVSLHTEEKILHSHSRRRIQHLQDLYEIPSLADVKYDEWSRVRLNRLLVDYLLRCGYGESARALAKEKGIEELVDLEVFVQCHRIERSLRNRNTSECLAWCAEHRPMMKKLDVCMNVLITVLGTDTDDHVHRTDSNSSCDCSSVLSYDAKDSFWKQGNMRENISRTMPTYTLTR